MRGGELMKKWLNIVFSSSLLFSTLGFSQTTIEASAKNTDPVQTAAVVKKQIFLGVKGAESSKEIKKLAKQKGWKLQNDYSRDYGLSFLDYAKVKVLGETSTLTFAFQSDTLHRMSYIIEHKKMSKKSEIKKYHNNLYKKVKKDLGNKKGTTFFEKYWASSPYNQIFYVYDSKWKIGKDDNSYVQLVTNNHYSVITVMYDYERYWAEMAG